MSTAKTDILTPVGRLVAGSLYKPQDKDAEGKPLVIKSGANAGQPRVDYFFAVAFPKGQEQHWAHTEWGAKVWAAGHAAFPNGSAQAPTFAWKITDGDSQVPNRKGVKPCTREGYPGHWVVSFGGGFAPRICNADGSALITEPDAVKLGYYVQVYGSVSGNGSPNQPGVFINHSAVSLQGYGQEIIVGLDPASVGFGKGAAPAGMSAAPIAQAPAVAPVAPAAPSAAYAPPAPVAAAYAPVAPPVAPGAPVVPAGVQPNPGFLNGPTAPAPVAPAAPAAPAAPPAGPQMTAAATTTYAAYRAAGWSDEQLRASGLML